MDGFNVSTGDMDLEKRFRSPLLIFADELVSTMQSWPLKIVLGFATACCLIVIFVGQIIAIDEKQQAKRQVVEQLHIDLDKGTDSIAASALKSDSATHLKTMLVWRSEKVTPCGSCKIVNL